MIRFTHSPVLGLVTIISFGTFDVSSLDIALILGALIKRRKYLYCNSEKIKLATLLFVIVYLEVYQDLSLNIESL